MNHPYRFLIRRLLIWLRHSFGILWLVGVAIYLMVLAGNAVYRNYASQQEMLALKERLQKAQLEEESLSALLVYYQTDSFKEKELRRTLLLKRPNERVYALPESAISKKIEEELAQDIDKNPKKASSKLPIWQQWVNYVLDNEKEA